jgi:succinoglycan biosynthesis protein ExoM
LLDLLESIGRANAREKFDVVVVDNDPDRSAITALADYPEPDGWRLIVAHEERPGIAAARNRGLGIAAGHYNFYCFVDDDEVVPPHWLDGVMNWANQESVDAVSGPVRSVFATEPPAWARLGGFFEAPETESGRHVPQAATNNLVMKADALERFGVSRFDERFSESGGSDIFLTAQLVTAGATIVWDNGMEVVETVPLERCRGTWIARRAIRTGGTHGRVMLWRPDTGVGRPGSFLRRLVVVAHGLARMLAGALAVLTCPLVNHYARGAGGLRKLLRGIGFVGVGFGLYVNEYRRTPENKEMS